MNVLAIDTATEVISVALRIEPGPEQGRGRVARSAPLPRVYAEKRDIGLKHSGVLMPLVGRLLAEASLRIEDLDLVACTRGPGSFTGLRIGMATAKGIAAAIASARRLDLPPMVSVPTLEVMAHAVPHHQAIVVPVIDGRKNRFYGAVFRAGARLTADLDLTVAQIMDEIAQARAPGSAEGGNRDRDREHGSVIVTGPHADLFASRLDDPNVVLIDPAFRRGHAEALIPLSITAYEKNGPDAITQGPVYIRSSDAELSRRKS